MQRPQAIRGSSQTSQLPGRGGLGGRELHSSGRAFFAPRAARLPYQHGRRAAVLPRSQAHTETDIEYETSSNGHHAVHLNMHTHHTNGAAKPRQQHADVVPAMWDGLAQQHGERVALIDPHHTPAVELTYRQLADDILQCAAGLQSMGLRSGEAVSLFSENGARWLVVDQAIMRLAAVDAVRGSTAPLEELQYILHHSRSVGLVVQDAATLDRLLPVLTAADAPSTLRFGLVLWGEPSPEAREALSMPLHTYAEVMARGSNSSHPNGNGSSVGTQQQLPPGPQPDDPATLVYTSGTSGNPKGVMLSHANLAYQVQNFGFYLQLAPSERLLSLLPPWHIYERAVTYHVFSKATTTVYSSIRKFRDDLAAYPPDAFVCVPLVLDTLYQKVRATLNKASPLRKALANTLLAASVAYVRAMRVVQGVALQYAIKARPLTAYVMALATVAALAPFHKLSQLLVIKKIRAAVGVRRVLVSGGGSLAAHLDDFFEAVGLPVLNGWGLTETSPVLACRRFDPAQDNVRGTVGLPMPGTQVRVVDPETKEDLAEDGQQGLLLAKGRGVMQHGYFNDPSATARAFPLGEGWFDTGDLGWRAPEGVAGSRMAGHIVLTGRAKDTIVLTSGKNIEPQPIEDAIQVSPFIKSIVLIGHAKRALGALVVPDIDALQDHAKSLGKAGLSADEVNAILKREINAVTRKRAVHEKVAAFAILKEPFNVEDGTVTRTLKPRRPVIMAKYAAEVAQVEAKLR